MISKRHRGFALVVVSLFLFAAFAGCGKKGQPLPPEDKIGKIAAPYDLKLTRIGDNIHLAWKHKTDRSAGSVTPESFEIFTAKKGFEACEGCPFKFESAGSVDMPRMEFFIPVQKGYKYYFRVQAADDGSMKSPYSKTVQIEFK